MIVICWKFFLQIFFCCIMTSVFYNFSIRFWNCSHNVVYFFFIKSRIYSKLISTNIQTNTDVMKRVQNELPGIMQFPIKATLLYIVLTNDANTIWWNMIICLYPWCYNPVIRFPPPLKLTRYSWNIFECGIKHPESYSIYLSLAY